MSVQRGYGIVCGVLALSLGIGAAARAADGGFLQPTVKTTGPVRSAQEQVNQFLRNLTVPPDIGTIKETHIPAHAKDLLVVNVQDMHCNYQAQKNIAAILDHLVTNYNVKVIAVEGGAGKIDTSFYRNLPDATVKEQVADYFLREARINGTEYFAITTDKDIALYGAEDQEYYDKNLNVFMDALPQRDKILAALDVVQGYLDRLKEKIYNQKMREFDSVVADYESDRVDFETYVQYLVRLYPGADLAKDFPQIGQLYDSIVLKQKLDIPAADRQRTEAVEFLTNNLARAELEQYLKLTLNFKNKYISPGEFHQELRQYYESSDKKTDPFGRRWPQLADYVDYLQKSETIQRLQLFEEIDQLLAMIKATMYTSYTQKMLDHYIGVVRLAKRLFANRMTQREITRITKYRDEFDSGKVVKFLYSQSKRLELDMPIPEGLDEMEKNLPMFEKFFEVAITRNKYLVENTLQAMTAEKEPIGILVTGGFHTDGMVDRMMNEQVRSVVIVPKVDEVGEQDDTRYINALQGKKTPFEEQLEREERQQTETVAK